ncbi:MAG: GNAT family N-acetyltransferase [Chloroflexi bacterium]|nr:GNAT family N-acetyltransferase [Chloroflexota bacterium]MBU1750841.1 GNAT family N-acetyltransferase [Chloroflexota bacterium]
MDIPTVTTDRLTLRPFTAEDVDALYCILSDPDVLRYFPNPNTPPRDRVEKFIAHQLAHWEEHRLGWWAVEPRAKPELMGWCGLQFLPETQETEVGYLLGQAYWGKGFATEGAWAALRYGFEDIGLDTIIALVHPDNWASNHVIEKLDMPFVDRNNYFGMDVNRYALERPGFQMRTGGLA